MSDWFYRSKGRTCGPVSREELEFLAASGHIHPATEVRCGQNSKWNPLKPKTASVTTDRNTVDRPSGIRESGSNVEDIINTNAPPIPAGSIIASKEGAYRIQVAVGIALGALLLLVLLLVFWNTMQSGGSPTGSNGGGVVGNDNANESTTFSQPTDNRSGEPGAATETPAADGPTHQPTNHSSPAVDGDLDISQQVATSESSTDHADLNIDSDSQAQIFAPGDPSSKFTISAPGEATFFGLQASGRNFAFVVDQSGSMAGLRLQQAKDELLKCLEGLPAQVQVLIVFFDDSVHPAPGGYSKLSPRRLMELEDWIDNVAVGGGTNVKAGMQHALTQTTKPDAVFLLTDGEFELDTPNFVKKT
jgi:hypothetical protein